MDQIARHIESLIFVADQPLSAREISTVLNDAHGSPIAKQDLDDALEAIKQRYAKDDYSYELVHINGGYQLMTKPAYHHTVGTYLKQLNRKKLSKSALETLSIIAYRQPIIKSEIEAVRGVNCDYAVQKLLDKELVEILGRSDGPGRPLLYGTSPKFMDYFGLSTIADLPKLKDIAPPEDSIGEVPDLSPSDQEE